jgi:MFS family permease
MKEERGRAAVRRLALGRLLSGTGGGVAAIALAAAVYDATRSAVWLSPTFFLTFGVTGLLSPLAGSIVDRLDRRRVMVASDLAGAAVWSVLLLGRSPVWLLTVGFIASVVFMPFPLATDASIPNIVGAADLAWANGLVSSARKAAGIAGPALGGVIAGTLGPRTAFAINAGSFVISAALVLSIRARFRAEQSHGSDEHVADLWAGFRLVWGDPGLRSLTVVWTVLWLTIDVALVADLPLAHLLGWGDRGYGYMNAAFGAGGLLGALQARRLPRRWEGPAVVVECVGVATGYVLTGLAPIFAFVLVGQAIAAGTDAVGEVAGTTIVQRATADQIRGRVIGAMVGVGLAANAVGFTFAGFLVDAVGPRWVYVGCGLTSAAVLPLLRPFLRSARATEVEPEAGASPPV